MMGSEKGISGVKYKNNELNVEIVNRQGIGD